MDGLSLLKQAQAAGLAVEAQGDKLVIRGPKRAEALALELIQQKAAVMAVLTASSVREAIANQRPLAAEGNEAGPRTITVNGTAYELKQAYGNWFFQMKGQPEANWTCCSPEFVKLIENAALDGAQGETANINPDSSATSPAAG